MFFLFDPDHAIQDGSNPMVAWARLMQVDEFMSSFCGCCYGDGGGSALKGEDGEVDEGALCVILYNFLFM